jgi:flagellar basal body-associated protein FliL
VKFKTTLILLAVFGVFLAFVLVFESRTKARQASKEKESKLVDLASADVDRISLNNGTETISFKKDEKGGWLITAPVEAPAEAAEVNRLAEDFSSLKFDRVVEAQAADPKKYEIPRKEVTLWYKGKAEPVRVLIGMENPIDSSLFAMREGEKRVVLLGSFLKSELDKKTLDFRQKDVFKFEPEEVASIRLKAGGVTWDAAKKDGEWHLQKPVAALANKSRVEDVLRFLSGLKAKEFVSEKKQDAEVAQFGLKDPEYVVSLSLPARNQDVTFTLHKQAEKIYATTSLSTKIILADTTTLADLEKKPEEIREKKVVAFNSWDAQKLRVAKGGLSLTVAKNTEGNWHFEDGNKAEADRSKVESLIRRVEGLEAVEFIDAPTGLAEYGLDKPQAEIAVWTKESDKEKEFRVLVGNEDAAKKQVVVRNPDLSYLFRVDASFLTDLPKDAKDWLPAPPVDKKPADAKSQASGEKK